MSEPFLGEIRLFGFSFAPRAWAKCDGQILAINQNQSLYSILGTNYGGDGRTTFALPDLRGRTPIHVGTGTGLTNHALGEKGGEEKHSLTEAEMPAHVHPFEASGADANQAGPTDSLLAKSSLASGTIYSTESDAQDVSLGAQAITETGSGAGHENMQPSLTVNFCISLQGLFPSRN